MNKLDEGPSRAPDEAVPCSPSLGTRSFSRRVWEDSETWPLLTRADFVVIVTTPKSRERFLQVLGFFWCRLFFLGGGQSTAGSQRRGGVSEHARGAPGLRGPRGGTGPRALPSLFPTEPLCHSAGATVTRRHQPCGSEQQD